MTPEFLPDLRGLNRILHCQTKCTISFGSCDIQPCAFYFRAQIPHEKYTLNRQNLTNPGRDRLLGLFSSQGGWLTRLSKSVTAHKLRVNAYSNHSTTRICDVFRLNDHRGCNNQKQSLLELLTVVMILARLFENLWDELLIYKICIPSLYHANFHMPNGFYYNLELSRFPRSSEFDELYSN